MSCNDILPEISIDGISVRQIVGSTIIDPSSVAGTFSPDADEEFELTISHTNLIEVENFLDSFLSAMFSMQQAVSQTFTT